MRLFRNKRKNEKSGRDTEMERLADFIAYEAAKNFKYDPDSDPVLRNFRRKLGLLHPKGNNN